MIDQYNFYLFRSIKLYIKASQTILSSLISYQILKIQLTRDTEFFFIILIRNRGPYANFSHILSNFTKLVNFN